MVNRAAAKLREQLARPDHILVCPGVYDGLSARVAINAGFETLYMTGAGTALSRLGMPDLGLTTVDDMATNAGMIASLDQNVTVIADADTGFGGPLMVARTVQKYISQGVAALHLEDQTTTKRCGHLMGKELVDVQTYTTRIRAADRARKDLNDDIVIIARTDALQSNGFDDAINRLKAAVEAGADVVFLEGMNTLEEMEKAAKVLAPTPCFLNMVAGGLTPLVTADEARKLGYKIQIWPMFGMTSAYLGYSAAAKELKETGEIKNTVGKDGKVQGGVREVFEAAGLSKYAAFDLECGGKAYSNGV